MVSYAFVDGFTRTGRTEAIARLKHAIAVADGVIVDFAFFAKEAIRLTVELDDKELPRLRKELESSGVELFPRCVAELESQDRRRTAEDPTIAVHRHPILAMLHVAFAPAELPLEALATA